VNTRKMTSAEKEINKLKKLVSTGNRIHLGFLIEYGFFDWVENIHDVISEKKPLSFRFSYEDWYSGALTFISIHKPDVHSEFTCLYRDEKNKESQQKLYDISDFLFGNEIRRSHDYSLKVAAVKQNLESQLNMLEILKTEI